MLVEASAQAAVVKAIQSKQGPLITLKSAEMKIGVRILEVLDAKFKGQLTEVRHPDDLDRLF